LLKKAVPVCGCREAECDIVASISPIGILRTAPWDVVVPRALAELGQRPKASNNGKVVRMDRGAKSVRSVDRHFDSLDSTSCFNAVRPRLVLF
jgi:hypothetical protein